MYRKYFCIISIEGFGITILVDVVKVKNFIYTSNYLERFPVAGGAMDL